MNRATIVTGCALVLAALTGGCGAADTPRQPTVKQSVLEGAAASDQASSRIEQREIVREQADAQKTEQAQPPKEPAPKEPPAPPPPRPPRP